MNNSNYYDKNSATYAESTTKLDLTDIYNKFLKHLPASAKILDLGCGAGRDTKVFFELGHLVTPLDSSIEMCRHTEKLTQLKVQHLNFSDINWAAEFDGVWACASLLHCPREQLLQLFPKIARALKPGGVFYCSFKYGNFSGERDDRHFTDLTEHSLLEILDEAGGFTPTELWQTQDVRPGPSGLVWLNAVLATG